EFLNTPLEMKFMTERMDLLLVFKKLSTGEYVSYRYNKDVYGCFEKMRTLEFSAPKLVKRGFSGNYYINKRFGSELYLSFGRLGYVRSGEYSGRTIDHVVFENGQPMYYRLKGSDEFVPIYLKERSWSRQGQAYDQETERILESERLKRGETFEGVVDLEGLALMSQVYRKLSALDWEILKRIAILEHEPHEVYKDLLNHPRFNALMLDKAGVKDPESLSERYFSLK
ncbi:MAG TPA: hypothetical protein PLU24_04310, partial [Candidatus Omnitrophota bacterium]|nr:hypothetical protein [Candidatus Omnitrophota bacterium]